MELEIRKSLIKNRDIFISCIVPVYNEEKVINLFLKELYKTIATLSHIYEIIVVDDGSTDNTFLEIKNIATEIPIKILRLSRNFGKEAALTAGLENCQGQVVIFIDSDFQHPISLIETFLKFWADGFDMVYGIRKERDAETVVKRNMTNIFYWLMQKITKIKLPRNAGDFRLLDKKIIDALKLFPERTRFMKGLYAWVGFKSIGIPFVVSDRATGRSSWHFSHLAELAITGITSFSDIPLRAWSFIGFIVSTLSILYAVYIILVTLIYGTDLPGFPSLIVAIMFLGGVQLLSIGILGEYIARIFTEVKNRPNYILESKDGFDR